jgi:hypothetical protein
MGIIKNKAQGITLGFIFKLAERQGFEPWVEVSPHTRLAGERLQPARPSLHVHLIG